MSRISFFRIKIGHDIFQSGDDLLQSCHVELSEGNGSGQCEFRIYDRNKEFAKKYFGAIEEASGQQSLMLSSGSQEKRSDSPSSSSTTSIEDESPEVRAFLDMLSEKESINGAYNVIVGGGRVDDLSRHPAIFNEAMGSDAAGRYQFLSATWAEEAAKIGVTDFSPVSQDRVAIQYLKTLGAYAHIVAGDLSAAIPPLLPSKWASLPGGIYQLWTFSEMEAFYNERLAFYRSLEAMHEQKQKVTESLKSEPTQHTISVSLTFAEQPSTIELGFDGQLMTAYSYLHQSLEFDRLNPDVLVFRGQAIAWVMDP